MLTVAENAVFRRPASRPVFRRSSRGPQVWRRRRARRSSDLAPAPRPVVRRRPSDLAPAPKTALAPGAKKTAFSATARMLRLLEPLILYFERRNTASPRKYLPITRNNEVAIKTPTLKITHSVVGKKKIGGPQKLRK